MKEPFHVAVARDKLDPQFRSYRAYMEMLYSGNLTRAQVETIVNYRAAHHDIILGIPTVYGYDTHEWGGFLSYGHGYGLLQHDFTREYLLLLYSLMAHQYTRGTWTAPETRLLDPKRFAAPYCTPAQMTVPLLTRWMLVFEEPAVGRALAGQGDAAGLVGGRADHRRVQRADPLGTPQLQSALASPGRESRGQRGVAVSAAGRAGQTPAAGSRGPSDSLGDRQRQAVGAVRCGGGDGDGAVGG